MIDPPTGTITSTGRAGKSVRVVQKKSFNPVEEECGACWTLTDNNLYTNDPNWLVGIGTASPNATLEVKGTVKIFGARETKSADTVYQAQTDGFVVAYGTGGHCGGGILGYANGELIHRSGSGYVDCSQGASITMPVRKGESWKVSKTGCLTISKIYWIPLGG